MGIDLALERDTKIPVSLGNSGLEEGHYEVGPVSCAHK